VWAARDRLAEVSRTIGGSRAGAPTSSRHASTYAAKTASRTVSSTAGERRPAPDLDVTGGGPRRWWLLVRRHRDTS